jgi:hypothetical protein
MDLSYDPELENRLAELTQKFGVGAGRVWDAFCRRAAFHALYDLAIGALFLAAIVGVMAADLAQGGAGSPRRGRRGCPTRSRTAGLRTLRRRS